MLAAPWRWLLVALLVTAAAGAFGATLSEHLGAAGFGDPHSDSVRGQNVLVRTFGQGDAELVLLVRSPGDVRAPTAAAAGRTLIAQLRSADHVGSVISPWDAGSADAVSADGRTAVVVVQVTGGESDAPRFATAIADRFVGSRAGLTISAGGAATVAADINARSESDLVRAEVVALPVSLIVLTWVFGGVLAAAVPLVVGVLAIVGTLGVLRLITLVTDVSVFALDVTTAMGLALSIDYTLLLVSRYREEYDRVGDRDRALRRAVATAGRTIAYSASTVFLAVGALAVFPMYFLRSMAFAGCAVIALSALYALVVAPAVLALLGDRIDALDLRAWVRRRRGRAGLPAVRETLLYRSSHWVMRHAPVCAVLSVIVLATLGAPFLDARFGLPDDRVLPVSAQSRQVGDVLRAQFPDATALSVVVPEAGTLTDRDVGDYAAALSRVPGVVAVSAPGGAYVGGRVAGPPRAPTAVRDGALWLSVQAPGAAVDPSFDERLDRLRAVGVPRGARALITGVDVRDRDAVRAILARLPTVGLLVVGSTLVLVFLLTGSLLLPIKAVVLNTLSLSATLGVLVWVFQEGHLGGLGTTTTGILVADVVVFLFVTAFGLSMDYEVFLLARIREHWLAGIPDDTADAGAHNAEAVALGIAGAGRVITAAACAMIIVFAALASAEVSFVRMIGVGLAVAVLVDATLVRLVLVPAVMKLAGRWNWWAPAPLARLHHRVALRPD